MNCSWSEEDAYRFAEGTLDPVRRPAFEEHLPHCAVCQAHVAEAQRLEGLLRDGITPVAAPVTLASRVANAVVAEREARRECRGLRLFGLHLSPALAGLAAALVLLVAAYAVAPGAVLAVAQRVLFFVPGLGIKPVGDNTLVATQPVSVRNGGLTFTVEALLSDGKQTTVKFRLSGLPGGKAGWETQRANGRQPMLRDAQGNTYSLQTAFSGVGGSPGENAIGGEMHFAPLLAGLDSVDLIVPLDYYVPEAVLPGAEQTEIVVHIALASPDQSGLPAATPQSALATANGVTLKVVGSSVEGERTVVLVEAEAEGPARMAMLGRMGGNPADAASLSDDRGRTYKLVPQGSEVTVGGDPLRKDLYFAPRAEDGTLTLLVQTVLVSEEGSADVTVSLAGHTTGERWELDQTVNLAGYEVLLRSATLADDAGQPWLYIDVELPAGKDGRALASFHGHRTGGSATMWSMGEGDRLERLGVPVEAGEQQVTIHLDHPVVVVEGPWEVSFPAGR